MRQSSYITSDEGGGALTGLERINQVVVAAVWKVDAVARACDGLHVQHGLSDTYEYSQIFEH